MVRLTKEERKQVLEGRKKQKRCQIFLSEDQRMACMKKMGKKRRGAVLKGADTSFNVY